MIRLCAALVIGLGGAGFAAEPSGKPNVLFIAVDDLNHWVGYTGRNPQAKTPNIDRLSRMGVSFTRAYCAAPLCNPSRAALMGGQRPSTTGCYQNNQNWKKFVAEGRGLTAAFKRAGYFVAGAGKVFHSDTFYPGEWDDYFRGRRAAAAAGAAETDAEPPSEPRARAGRIAATEGFLSPVKHELRDEDVNDWHTVGYCIEQLGRDHERPFFLACGLHKPHLPWVVPQKYYDLFPIDSIQLPPHKDDDLADVPPAGVQMARPSGDHKAVLDSGRWKAAIQAYLASMAYADMNIGRLLDALEKSPHRGKTIIVLWGDHGWHLGEKRHWRKFTLWEEATRAPLIWVVPGMTPAGALCHRTVDFMSLYPTLCDLAGVTCPDHVEGKSIKTLLREPAAPWTAPALTTFGFRNHAVRDETWRYIRYADGSEELYDHSSDPHEWTNLAGVEAHAAVKERLSKWLPKDDKPARDNETPSGAANRPR